MPPRQLKDVPGPHQVILWERGRPAANAPQARMFIRSGAIRFRASRSLRAGRPRSQQIT